MGGPEVMVFVKFFRQIFSSRSRQNPEVDRCVIKKRGTVFCTFSGRQLYVTIVMVMDSNKKIVTSSPVRLKLSDVI